MKKSLLPIVASGIILFSACTNENSSTVATQDDEEQSSTSHSEGKEHQTENKEGSHTSDQKGESASATGDTVHTNMSFDRDSAGVLNHQGKGASMDSRNKGYIKEGKG